MNKRTMTLITLNKLFILFLLIIIGSNSVCAQENPFNLIKFGIKGYSGIIDTCRLNSIVSEWIDQVAEKSNAELAGEPFTLPFNVEYGFQPFLVVQPLSFLQIGAKMDIGFSGLTGTFQNPMINTKYGLYLKTRSYIPGVYADLVIHKLELGGGFFYSNTTVSVDDNFFGYKNTWFGGNPGYELHIGYSSSREKSVGFTMDLKYRSLLIDDLKDNLNRTITDASNHGKMALKMTGFIIDMGIFFQFIEMGKVKDEN